MDPHARITVHISGPTAGDPGKPVHTELMPDGARRHTLADGRVFEEDGPRFRLSYKSMMPGESYEREIAIFGLAERKHLFEAWCYVKNALRSYAFHKVVWLQEMATEVKYSGEELRKHLGGEKLPGKSE